MKNLQWALILVSLGAVDIVAGISMESTFVVVLGMICVVRAMFHAAKHRNLNE